MTPAVLDKNSIALTAKHKREQRLEKCHDCHNSADYRSRQCVMQDLDLMRVKKEDLNRMDVKQIR